MSEKTPPVLRESATFDRLAIQEIQRAAETGIYDIRGGGTKRKLPHFDDLLLLGASVSRYPLEGYREKCGTDVVLGNRFAKKPIHLKIPVTIAGMSFGALSANAKGSVGPWRDHCRYQHHHRRRRHDPGRAWPVAAPCVSVPAIALWHEPGRSAQGRCHRDRFGAGRRRVVAACCWA